MRHWRDIMGCQDTVFDELIAVYEDFCQLIETSKYVRLEGNYILIDYLSYAFKSKYRVVFDDNNTKIRVKFVTTSIDDDELFFDIFIDRYGVLTTGYSPEIDRHSINMLKSENIEKVLATLVYGFFKNNDLLSD